MSTREMILRRDRVDALRSLYGSQERLNVERTVQVMLDNSLIGLKRENLERYCPQG